MWSLLTADQREAVTSRFGDVELAIEEGDDIGELADVIEAETDYYWDDGDVFLPVQCPLIDTVADHADDVTEIDETGGNARVEWGNADSAPVIVWNEHLKFHTEHLAPEYLLGDPEDLPKRVEEKLALLLPGGYETAVQWSDQDEVDGYPFLMIEVWPTEDIAPTTPVSAAYDVLWPAIASLHNVTDPGTFNSPYLFAEVAVNADEVHERLEALRNELEAERISYGELAELQGLAWAIPEGDVQLREAAGLPEFTD